MLASTHVLTEAMYDTRSPLICPELRTPTGLIFHVIKLVFPRPVATWTLQITPVVKDRRVVRENYRMNSRAVPRIPTSSVTGDRWRMRAWSKSVSVPQFIRNYGHSGPVLADVPSHGRRASAEGKVAMKTPEV